MIRLYHVTKSYRREAAALQDASLTVHPRQFCFITGPSGAGKSTLLKLIIREEQPTSGQILVNGQEAGNLRIVEFAEGTRFLKEGETLLVPENAGDTGTAAERTRVHQGYVEKSNVDPVLSMTEMIDVIRGFESYQKVIQTLDEMTGQALQVGRPT